MSLVIIIFIVSNLFLGVQNASNPPLMLEPPNNNQSRASEVIGAWETHFQNDEGVEVKVIAIVTDRYISSCEYNLEDKQFLNTNGGLWKIEDGKFVLTYEFNTSDPSRVGQQFISEFTLDGNTLSFPANPHQWTRIDDGTPGDLQGAWLITGRKRNGEISSRTPGARKTMKILSGTRFQWIAYNTETGQFSGTGGGTYTTVDGKYTENIEFFSRDGSRVGASLEFDYKLEDGGWHHSGFSSTGNPLYEIWTQRAILEQ